MKRIYFRAMELIDLEFINKIRNDDFNYKLTCGNKYYTSRIKNEKWIIDKSMNNETSIYFMICLLNSDDTIGYCSINNIDHQNQKAQYGGISIDKDYSSQGFATEATKMLLDFAFNELNLNMIYGFWKTDHAASLKMAENCGFKNSGIIEDYGFKQGRFYDAYIYTLKRTEFGVQINQNEKD